MKTAKVDVRLEERAYQIHIGGGLLERAGQLLAPHLHRPRTVIVTDENVFAAHGRRLIAGLGAEGVSAETIVLAPGEGTKSMASLSGLLDRLIELEVDRSDLIVAFGGGVIGDLTGFAAAVLRRGCAFAQVPTSLLAQVDSSVGGKTAVNASKGKNLVGAFHQPAIVIADIGALDSLPARELRAGYAEIVKYGALGDAAFFGWLESNGAAALAGDAAARIEAVRHACAMKAAIVARDERETGERALLNLGHTFGHALEAAYGFSDALLHGEAVAAGMGLAFDYSARHGACPAADAARLKAHLRAAGLPAGLSDLNDRERLDADGLLALMRQDKKVSAGKLTLILARRLGEAYIAKDADPDAIRAFLADALA